MVSRALLCSSKGVQGGYLGIAVQILECSKWLPRCYCAVSSLIPSHYILIGVSNNRNRKLISVLCKFTSVLAPDSALILNSRCHLPLEIKPFTRLHKLFACGKTNAHDLMRVCVLSDTLVVFFKPHLLFCVIVVKGVS